MRIIAYSAAYYYCYKNQNTYLKKIARTSGPFKKQFINIWYLTNKNLFEIKFLFTQNVIKQFK